MVEPETTDHRPHQAGVTVDQCAPGDLVVRPPRASTSSGIDSDESSPLVAARPSVCTAARYRSTSSTMIDSRRRDDDAELRHRLVVVSGSSTSAAASVAEIPRSVARAAIAPATRGAANDVPLHCAKPCEAVVVEVACGRDRSVERDEAARHPLADRAGVDPSAEVRERCSVGGVAVERADRDDDSQCGRPERPVGRRRCRRRRRRRCRVRARRSASATCGEGSSSYV